MRTSSLKSICAILLIAAAVCILCYFFIDLPLTKWVAHTCASSRILALIGSRLIDPDDHYLLWPIAFFIFRFLWKKEAIANRCLLLAMSVPLANLVVELVKFPFGRARPSVFFASDQFGLTFFATSNDFLSFPSGHAGTAGALCGAFACFYPRAVLPLGALALILAFSRVVMLKHYLSDIIAGIVIGSLISLWVYSLMKKNHIKFTRR